MEPIFLKAQWDGIEPIPQDDGPRPVVAIAYTEQYVYVSGLLRWAMREKEASARVFRLTSAVIANNPAHYTAWHVRLQSFQAAIEAGVTTFEKEMAQVSRMLRASPKNYQLWNYRRRMATDSGSLAAERAFAEEAISDDSKNYHAWSHRVWSCDHFRCWSGEAAFARQLIEADIRNNSAWNHLWTAQLKRPLWTEGAAGAAGGAAGGEVGGQPGPLVAQPSDFRPTTAQRVELVQWALDKLRRARGNEAACNFLRACFEDHLAAGADGAAQAAAVLVELLPPLRALTAGEDPPAAATALLADALEEQLRSNLLPADEAAAARREAAAAERLLETRLDTVRAAYWASRRRQLEAGATAE